MSIDQSTADQVAQTPESPIAQMSEMSFSDYQKFRRGETVESAHKSAPVEKTAQKQAGESEASETDADENEELELSAKDKSDSEESKSDKPQKKGGFQRRIDKLNARIAEREREIEQLRSQAMNKGPGEQKQDQPQVEKTVEAQGKPKPENFETHAEYVEALTDWKLTERENLSKAEQAKAQLMSEQEKIFNSHRERVQSFAKTVEDFDEAMENLADVRSPTIQQVILESENGPEILYELAKNPDEAKRIASLSPVKQAVEMGLLQAKISARSSEKPKQEPKKLTSAPKPIDPVGNSKGSVAKSIDDPDLSYAEYEKLRRAQMNRRR